MGVMYNGIDIQNLQPSLKHSEYEAIEGVTNRWGLTLIGSVGSTPQSKLSAPHHAGASQRGNSVTDSDDVSMEKRTNTRTHLVQSRRRIRIRKYLFMETTNDAQ